MKDLHALDKYRQTDAERGRMGCNGDGGNGYFKVYVDGRSFFVVASNGGGWDHVSVSPCNQKRQLQPCTDPVPPVRRLSPGDTGWAWSFDA